MIGDPTDPFYASAEERLEDKEELDDSEGGDNESSDEDGEGKSSDDKGMAVDKGERGVPLYGRRSRILLGNK